MTGKPLYPIDGVGAPAVGEDGAPSALGDDLRIPVMGPDPADSVVRGGGASIGQIKAYLASGSADTVGGDVWRADLQVLLADSTLTYTAGEPGTVEAGQIVKTLDGLTYRVAADTATDHHLTTGGGIKLYALASSTGYDAAAFGVVGDGAADDSAAIQAALDAVGDNGRLIIPPGTYKITSTPTIALSTTEARLEIIAYGATFEITGAIAGLARERPTDVTTTYTKAKITVRGLNVVGNNTTGQHGFRFFTTYGLVIEECAVTDCDIGFVSVFGMMARVKSCFATNNDSYGFYFASGGSTIDFGSGAETAITGGTANNSNSNGVLADQCRVFAKDDSLAHFKIDACEAEIANPIVEGGNSDNCFEYDNLGSTVSKGLSIKEPHVECTPDNAVYKLYTSTGTMTGTCIIEGQDTVITTSGWTGALFDLGTIRPAITIKMVSNKSLYNVDNICKGPNDAYHPTFIVDTINPSDWTDSANWGSGVVGLLVPAAPLRNASNGFEEIFRRPVTRTTYSTFNWATMHLWTLTAGNDVVFDYTGKPANDFKLVGQSTGGFLLDGRFKYGQAEGSMTTLGTVVGRMPIYDAAGAMLGYAPLYDDIT